MSEFKRIPPEQAQALREQGAVVVDVRDPATFAALHITGSKHLDNHSLHAFIQGADLDAPTVVVCYHGNSSQGAAAYLISQGFSDVYSMDGVRLIRRKPRKAPPNNFFVTCRPRLPWACARQTNGLPHIITYLAFTSRIPNYP